MHTPAPPLRPWPELSGLPTRPLAGGLINATFVVGAAGETPRAVVQRLHPVFRPEVNLDIAAVTAHLAARGVVTPTVLPTGGGALWHLDEAGACWRALSWVPGETHHRLRGAAMARSAGALVGRWHQATVDLEHEFHFTRPGAHDTPGHMAGLEAALGEHAGHRLLAEVSRVAEELLGAWATWEGDLERPARLAHGDLKVSNLRFDGGGQATALIDLDTVARLPLDVELGDAWRSWCNPCSEDDAAPRFDAGLFEASARGYLEANPLAADERGALPGGIERICLELAARFAADALRERYFGWSAAVAPTRGDHNLLRARGQVALARSVRAQRAVIERVLAGA